MRNAKAFTLIELLVVIAIIAVLAVTIVLTLNPAQLLRQARDSNRINDLSTIKTALALYLTDVSVPNLASSTQGYTGCYLSTTQGNGTSTAKCGVFVGASITSNVSTTVANYRKVDSTGWLPVRFSAASAGSAMSVLPVDPLNTALYYYAYAATTTGFFEVNAFMESAKYGRNGSKDMTQTDGGDNANTYESGNSPGLAL